MSNVARVDARESTKDGAAGVDDARDALQAPQEPAREGVELQVRQDLEHQPVTAQEGAAHA